jgi:hypothetical protein
VKIIPRQNRSSIAGPHVFCRDTLAQLLTWPHPAEQSARLQIR